MPCRKTCGGSGVRSRVWSFPEQVRLGGRRFLTTELVTNSIRHAGLGPERLRRGNRCFWSGAVLSVVIVARQRVPGRPALGVVAGSFVRRLEVRSRSGLYLVDRLAARWGTNFEGSSCGTGSNSSTPRPSGSERAVPFGPTLQRPLQRYPPASPPTSNQSVSATTAATSGTHVSRFATTNQRAFWANCFSYSETV